MGGAKEKAATDKGQPERDERRRQGSETGLAGGGQTICGAESWDVAAGYNRTRRAPGAGVDGDEVIAIHQELNRAGPTGPAADLAIEVRSHIQVVITVEPDRGRTRTLAIDGALTNVDKRRVPGTWFKASCADVAPCLTLLRQPRGSLDTRTGDRSEVDRGFDKLRNLGGTHSGERH